MLRIPPFLQQPRGFPMVFPTKNASNRDETSPYASRNRCRAAVAVVVAVVVVAAAAVVVGVVARQTPQAWGQRRTWQGSS